MKKMNILDSVGTIDYLLKHDCSLARLGNGEMDIILGDNKNFQSYNKNLAKELRNVKTTESLLLCVPCLLENKMVMNNQNNSFYYNHRKQTLFYWRKYYNKNKVLGDTNISRFYIDSKDKKGIREYIAHLSLIWDKKNVVFVEGKETRLGVGNNLFDNTNTIERILCPSENAYNKIDEIESFILNSVSKTKLLILALGPTATVLSYRLSQKGYRSLDLGHVDIEYEWYLLKADKKVAIAGKYVNEVESGRKPENLLSGNKYNQQVIARIY